MYKENILVKIKKKRKKLMKVSAFTLKLEIKS